MPPLVSSQSRNANELNVKDNDKGKKRPDYTGLNTRRGPSLENSREDKYDPSREYRDILMVQDNVY